jgi:hypothetical protein
MLHTISELTQDVSALRMSVQRLEEYAATAMLAAFVFDVLDSQVDFVNAETGSHYSELADIAETADPAVLAALDKWEASHPDLDVPTLFRIVQFRADGLALPIWQRGYTQSEIEKAIDIVYPISDLSRRPRSAAEKRRQTRLALLRDNLLLCAKLFDVDDLGRR